MLVRNAAVMTCGGRRAPIAPGRRPIHAGTEAEAQLLRGYVAQRLQWALGSRARVLPNFVNP